MSVQTVEKDRETLTMTVAAEYDATVERVWKLWADARQLEQWWGPPTHPATFVEYDLRSGGGATYFMTGSEGEKYHGWWRFISVASPHSIEIEDGFADDNGEPNSELPVTTFEVSIAERSEGGTRMTITSKFASLDAMDQLIEMGMEEGSMAAIGQIDGILAAEVAA